MWYGEILMDSDISSVWLKISWRMIYHGPINAWKLDVLNFDSLAGKRQNIKIFPIKFLRYTVH